VTTDAAVAWLREQVQWRLGSAKAAAGPSGDRWYSPNWTAKAVDIGEGPAWVVFTDHSLPVAEAAGLKKFSPLIAVHIARNDPQDVIARCEAELAILGEHAPQRDYPGKCQRCITDRKGYPEEWADDDYPCLTVQLLASGYRHREGYAAHWGDARERTA
jgi:hypothetical protein